MKYDAKCVCDRRILYVKILLKSGKIANSLTLKIMIKLKVLSFFGVSDFFLTRNGEMMMMTSPKKLYYWVLCKSSPRFWIFLSLLHDFPRDQKGQKLTPENYLFTFFLSFYQLQIFDISTISDGLFFLLPWLVFFRQKGRNSRKCWMFELQIASIAVLIYKSG